MRALVGALGLSLILLAAACAQAAETLPLTIETPDGASHAFEVELADTGDERARGLMFRRELAADAGMLFVYDEERQVAMWMKNTLIPLDMLFVAADGRVVRIAERAEPLSLRTLESGQPVKYVLEIAGGRAAELGLTPGAVLHSPAIGVP